MNKTPLKVIIKRLWNGKATVRHYLANQAYREGRDMLIECNGQQMLVPHNQIASGVDTGQEHTSKIDGTKYKLIDYQWKPENIKLPLLD